jgi:hypothetical protein
MTRDLEGGIIHTVNGSPLKPFGFVCHDMIECYGVKRDVITSTVLHIRVEGIEGGLEAIMEAMPRGVIQPPVRRPIRHRTWVEPKPKPKPPELKVDEEELVDLDEDALEDVELF